MACCLYRCESAYYAVAVFFHVANERDCMLLLQELNYMNKSITVAIISVNIMVASRIIMGILILLSGRVSWITASGVSRMRWRRVHGAMCSTSSGVT